MKRELAKQLTKDFPLTFAVYPEGREPWSMFGFEVGDGWEPSIRATAEKLEPLFAENILLISIPVSVDKYISKTVVKGLSKILPTFFLKFLNRYNGFFRTSQLKEKFGTGRWYLSGTEQMMDITSDWESRTDTICETCGQPGKLNTNGWWYTACWDHTKISDRDSLEILERASEEKESDNG